MVENERKLDIELIGELKAAFCCFDPSNTGMVPTRLDKNPPNHANRWTTLQRRFKLCIPRNQTARPCVPNFHVHTSVSDLYIPRIAPPILLLPNRQNDRGNIKIAHRYMNVEIGTEAAQLHLWYYLFSIFGTASLQCRLLQVANCVIYMTMHCP
jgi:hypothetical protein